MSRGDLPERIDRYTVVSRLAEGGMAEILLAKREGPGGFERPVVIKRIHSHLASQEEFRSMFLDEARIVAGLQHANVVQVYELAEQDNELFLVMEYLAGASLDRMLRAMEQKEMPIVRALAVHAVAEACAGVHAAHELRDTEGRPLEVVHRDISPQNIFISHEGAVKVLDFGVAKAVQRDSQTAAGQLKGKLAYMSPEQASGQPLDRRTDIFSLGVVLWEATVGERLFAQENQLATLGAIVRAPIRAPSDIDPDYPAALESICLKALSRNLGARYQSAGELRRALLDLGPVVGPLERARGQLSELIQSLFDERLAEERALLSGNSYDVDFTDTATGPLKTIEIIKGSSPDIATPSGEDEREGSARAFSVLDEVLIPTVRERRPRPKSAVPQNQPVKRVSRLWLALAGVLLFILGYAVAVLFIDARRANDEQTDTASLTAELIGRGDAGVTSTKLVPEPNGQLPAASARSRAPDAAGGGTKHADDSRGGPSGTTATDDEVGAAPGATEQDPNRADDESTNNAETITIEINSQPRRAMVFIDGVKASRTPTTLNLPRGHDPVELKLFRRGFTTRFEKLVPDRDQRLELVLARRGQRNGKTSGRGAQKGASKSSGGFYLFE